MSEVTRTILGNDGRRWRVSLPKDVWENMMTDLLKGMRVATRHSDPVTSKQAAKDLTPRVGTQRMTMLRAYAYGGQLTDEEAADLVDLEHTCYWKRASELRQGGFIAPVYEDGKLVTRKGKAGSPRMVCGLTDKGRAIILRSE